MPDLTGGGTVVRIINPGFIKGLALVSGPPGQDGANGADGADGSNGAPGAPGVGVPAGGATGQVLKKTSATDYATNWGALAALDVGAASRTQGGAEASGAGSATTGAVTLNCSTASVFTISPTAAISLAPSNVPASGTACTITVVITQGATAYAVTPPAGTKWVGSAAPTQVASKACVLTLMTINGGTTWYASGAVEV